MKLKFNSSVYFVTGILTGALPTYWVTKKILRRRYDEAASREIQHILNKNLDDFIPSQIREELVDRDISSKDSEDTYNEIVSEYEIGTEPPVLVTDSDIPDEPHDPNVPYVISQFVFLEEDTQIKTALAYYEDDDVLIDEDLVIVDDITATVGNALQNFGKGSNNPDVVYVRNDRLDLDMEVVRHEGSFIDQLSYAKSQFDDGGGLVPTQKEDGEQ